MGCEFNFQELKATDADTAQKEVSDLISAARYDYGHAGYSGSFAEATGIEVRKGNPFKNTNAAEDWLSDHAEKWGPAIIAKVEDGSYVVGANCSS